MARTTAGVVQFGVAPSDVHLVRCSNSIDDAAKAFYVHFGFKAFQDTPLTL